jgi:hypothetical protein
MYSNINLDIESNFFWYLKVKRGDNEMKKNSSIVLVFLIGLLGLFATQYLPAGTTANLTQPTNTLSFSLGNLNLPTLFNNQLIMGVIAITAVAIFIMKKA